MTAPAANLALSVEERGKVDFSGLIADERRLQCRFRLWEKAGRAENLDSLGRLQPGKIFEQLTGEAVDRGFFA